jgi:hypothetical protein
MPNAQKKRAAVFLFVVGGVCLIGFLVTVIADLSHESVDEQAAASASTPPPADAHGADAFKAAAPIKTSPPQKRNDPWKIVFEGLKTVFIAVFSGLAIGVFDHFFVIQETTDEIAHAIAQKMSAEMEDLIGGRHEYGLVRFKQAMNFDELFESLKANDVLLWLDTYYPFLDRDRQAFERALERGARFQFLVVDDACANMKYRVAELPDFKDVHQFAEGVRGFTSTIVRSAESVQKRLPGATVKCEIRSYSDLPCIPMYIVQREGAARIGYSSFFLSSPTGVSFPHLEWCRKESGGFLAHMEEYFNRKWERQLSAQSGGRVLYPKGASSPSPNVAVKALS